MDLIRLYAGGFPLTIERLEFLQATYGKAISQLCNFAGTGKIIVSGAVLDDAANPTTVTDGVLIINGEIIEFRGGAYSAQIGVFENEVLVPYNVDADQDGNLDQKVADVTRWVQADQAGSLETHNFSDFKRIGNLQTVAPMVGEIKMIYADVSNLPDGWVVCDGTDGTPDLRGRVPLGAGIYEPTPAATQGLINYPFASTGGAPTIQLTKNNLPDYLITGNTQNDSHTHGHRDNLYVEEGNFGLTVGVDGVEYLGAGSLNRNSGTDQNGSTVNSHYQNRNTSSNTHAHGVSLQSGGSDTPHENRQPYVAVNYIMFKGF